MSNVNPSAAISAKPIDAGCDNYVWYPRNRWIVQAHGGTIEVQSRRSKRIRIHGDAALGACDRGACTEVVPIITSGQDIGETPLIGCQRGARVKRCCGCGKFLLPLTHGIV